MVPINSSLVDNIVYRMYLPNAVIIISTIYIFSYLVQSITKLYRQRQKWIERQERERLKANWKQTVARQQCINDLSRPQPVYHSSSSSSSSLTLYNHHPDHSTENTYFWTRQQKKRLQLLWNWSVAMGYCEYRHGKELNALIEMLLKERNGN